jgi:hypothetical protein
VQMYLLPIWFAMSITSFNVGCKIQSIFIIASLAKNRQGHISNMILMGLIPLSPFIIFHKSLFARPRNHSEALPPFSPQGYPASVYPAG